jgi:hypothetical protein
MATIDYIEYFTKSFLNQDQTSNLGKLWKLFSIQLDLIEDQVTALKNILSITDNIGINLDRIGTLVNQERAFGKVDSLYRLDLLVAIMSRISGGTIPELVSIGKIIAGNDPAALFRPYEMWQGDNSSIYLDASDLMDGHGVFSPSTSEPAAIESRIEGDVDSIEVPLSVSLSLDKVRGGGIYSKFHIIFFKHASGMTRYIGSLATVSSIAIGDGATRDPLPEDTGLENEIMRKNVGVSISPEGYPQYSMTVYEDELNTTTINEMAIFDSLDIMIVKYRFDGKEKNSSMIYIYRVIDDLS